MKDCQFQLDFHLCTIDILGYHLHYMESQSCRSYFINQYFGDVESRQCGICDNCLHKKSSALSTTEFNFIAQTILAHLAKKSYSTSELINELGAIKRESLWEVLRFLQAENKIQASAQGNLALTPQAMPFNIDKLEKLKGNRQGQALHLGILLPGFRVFDAGTPLKCGIKCRFCNHTFTGRKNWKGF